MDKYTAAFDTAEDVATDPEMQPYPQYINMAQVLLEMKDKIKPVAPDAMIVRLNAFRNCVIEQIAKQIEQLNGRKRGEINKETAQYVRRLKK